MGDYGAPVSCVAFSHDSRQLAATSFDYSLRIFDVESGEREPKRHIRAHNSLALGIAFSADGRRLATVGMDRVVALWDSASGRQVLALRDLHTEVFCVRFSPDGQRLAASSADGTIHVWDAAKLTGAEDKSLLTLRYPGEVWSMDFSSRTNWHAYTGDHFSQPKLKEAPVLICETGTDGLVRRLAGHSVVVFNVVFDPTGPFLATSGDEPSRLGNATLKVWDLTTGAEPFSIEPVDSGVVFALAYSNDGQRLIGGGSDRKVKVWNAKTGRMIGVIGEHKGEITSLALSPDGKHLASAGSDSVVKLWDATRLDERQENPVTFEATRGDVSTSVAFSEDSARFGVATGNVAVTLQSRAHRFLALAFSPDGRWIASGGADCIVQLWDAQTGRLRHTFRGHTGAVSGVGFVRLPEGMRLAACRTWKAILVA